MKHLRLYENFEDGKLYRNTSIRWLVDLLEHGHIDPYASDKKHKRFISFSEKEDSGGQDNYGDVRIEFDAKKLYAQGAIEVEYDTDFFSEHPDISAYITGYSDEDSYYKDKGYDDKEDYENNGQEDANTLSWETTIEDYSEEAEVVIKKLKYEDGLITCVIAPNSKGLEIVRKKGIKIEKK